MRLASLSIKAHTLAASFSCTCCMPAAVHARHIGLLPAQAECTLNACEWLKPPSSHGLPQTATLRVAMLQLSKQQAACLCSLQRQTTYSSWRSQRQQEHLVSRSKRRMLAVCCSASIPHVSSGCSTCSGTSSSSCPCSRCKQQVACVCSLERQTLCTSWHSQCQVVHLVSLSKRRMLAVYCSASIPHMEVQAAQAVVLAQGRPAAAGPA